MKMGRLNNVEDASASLGNIAASGDRTLVKG
jgi:hypothetical protein